MGEKGNVPEITGAEATGSAEQAVAQKLASAQHEMTTMQHGADQISKFTGAVAPVLGDDDSTGPPAAST